jgi:hypothetical protein
VAETPQIGEPFDPADLSDEEATRVLEAVDRMPGLPASAKRLYHHLFTQARKGIYYNLETGEPLP